MNKKLKAVADALSVFAESLAAIAEEEDVEAEAKGAKAETETVMAEAGAGEVKAEAKEEKEPEKKYTFEEVRQAMSAKSGAGFTAEIRAILEKHGASRLSDIQETEYAAMMEEVEAIGSPQ